MSQYEKNICALILERELTTGKICKCQSHKHIMATTISCLRAEPKQAYKINYYNR